jgi:hypothetical protein
LRLQSFGWLSRHWRTLLFCASLGVTDLALLGYTSHFGFQLFTPLASLANRLIVGEYFDSGVLFLALLTGGFAVLRFGFKGLAAVLGLSAQLTGTIGLFDNGEFNIHVTSWQEGANVAMWFTNSLLLWLSLGGLALIGACVLAQHRWPRLRFGSIKLFSTIFAITLFLGAYAVAADSHFWQTTPTTVSFSCQSGNWIYSTDRLSYPITTPTDDVLLSESQSAQQWCSSIASVLGLNSFTYGMQWSTPLP